MDIHFITALDDAIDRGNIHMQFSDVGTKRCLIRSANYGRLNEELIKTSLNGIISRFNPVANMENSKEFHDVTASVVIYDEANSETIWANFAKANTKGPHGGLLYGSTGTIKWFTK